LRIRILAVAAGVIVFGFVSYTVHAQEPMQVPVDDPAQSFGLKLLPGFLSQNTLPDSNTFLPAPPASGSAADNLDQTNSKSALALTGTERFRQATLDADIGSPKVIGLFSCAAGIELGPETTPKTNTLLHKVMTDLGLGGYPTKNKYKRKRPFMINGLPTCTPDLEKALAEDGSYPSGHSAVGYGWGLILAELLPERTGQLVERARKFGDSRMVCNVHWLSDVEEGRNVASAVVARLHASAEFRDSLIEARAELKAVGTSPSSIECNREAAALAVQWEGDGLILPR